ncbi:S4 domain-containing protein YaaA [Laceyella sacchari]|jgi:S4 domain protein YaaA|uniref:S4 domain protein YaaA n=2 Tax=Laceyella TaxID=292635 RepID=A0AA46AG83_9BACL|nr:S4 domain-containing protein YaaA [Laceyella sacchari]PRZ16618.1 S4 domain protein YaaA [Laceyella sediminis]TCW39363.1 S4 domain protein YaaA [Laceyella sacchari]SMP25680.1 S4 domain protein YaaA [Laceyella tengchongensis]
MTGIGGFAILKKIHIEGSYITLGQLLKMLDMIDSGGQAKHFLMDVEVKVNGEVETRRGRKLYPQDIVAVDGFGSVQVVQD